jgi:hypothetical protein
MTLLSLIVGTLVLMALWGLAWKSSPMLAIGILIGGAAVWAVAVILQPSAIQHIPIWLPPLPFAVVAATLFYFGALAWLWGERH